MSVHSLRVSVLPFQTSETGDTHVYFIRPVAPTPRSEPSELQHLYRNSAAGLPQKNSQRELTGIAMTWLRRYTPLKISPGIFLAALNVCISKKFFYNETISIDAIIT